MKRKLTWLWSLPIVLCLAGTLLYAVLFVWSDDKTPPVITLASPEREVSVTAPKETLLEGVTALDDRDGDVTAGIVVEKISNINKDHTATITYAAFDRAGNVAKVTGKIVYTDYSEPRFGLSRALVFQAGSGPDLLSFLSAEDVLDGDLSRQVKGTLVSATTSLSYAGLHQVDFRVTNSMGDTVHLLLPVEVYEAGSYNATVSLEEYLVYVNRGEAFDALAYPEYLTVGGTRYSLKGDDPEIRLTVDGEVIAGADGGANLIEIKIETTGTVNVDIPGVYSVAYTVTMNRYVGYTRLNVVVE